MRTGLPCTHTHSITGHHRTSQEHGTPRHTTEAHDNTPAIDVNRELGAVNVDDNVVQEAIIEWCLELEQCQRGWVGLGAVPNAQLLPVCGISRAILAKSETHGATQTKNQKNNNEAWQAIWKLKTKTALLHPFKTQHTLNAPAQRALGKGTYTLCELVDVNGKVARGA